MMSSGIFSGEKLDVVSGYQFDFHFIAGVKFVGRLGLPAVYEDVLIFDKVLQPRATPTLDL